MRFTNISNRKALKSLQKVAGLYGLVVPCEDVQFPGAVVGHFTGGEPLRAVLPKVWGGVDKELSSEEGVGGTYTGYGLYLWDNTMVFYVLGFAGMMSFTVLKLISHRRHSRSNVFTVHLINISIMS